MSRMMSLHAAAASSSFKQLFEAVRVGPCAAAWSRDDTRDRDSDSDTGPCRPGAPAGATIAAVMGLHPTSGLCPWLLLIVCRAVMAGLTGGGATSHALEL